MKFLLDNEFLILMNNNDQIHGFSVGDKARMRSAGIQTCHEQPSWAMIEPARGQYNWAVLDNLISENRQAGMKSLIQICGWKCPGWMPNDWFCKTRDGKFERECLSLWNEEAQQHSDQYYRDVISHYRDQKDVYFFFGEWQGGEGVLPPTWSIYDEYALKDFRSIWGASSSPVPDDPKTLGWMDGWVMSHQLRKAKIFYEFYGEIWNAQQYLMNVWTKAFGNDSHPVVLQSFRNVWPDINIVLIQYTYFDSAHDENNVRYVDDLVAKTNCEVIVEAMFCAGLPTTTPKAIAKGFRGQIVHPQRSGFDFQPIEDWMITNIKNSHDLWMKSRETVK